MKKDGKYKIDSHMGRCSVYLDTKKKKRKKF